jgi:hypothetical protein
MIRLDDPEKWLPKLDECAERYLSDEELVQYAAIPQGDREGQLRALLTSPIARFTVINEVYFRSRWGEVIKRLQPEGGLTLLEIASGDADMIPQCMARTCPGSSYITANMNQKLNESLLQKIGTLPLDVKLIADDAANIRTHLAAGQVDIVAFQHAVNDVLQAILCAQHGIDTVFADWMETLPAMIGLLRREVDEGTLEKHVRAPFMALMDALWPTLRRGGHVAINHYMFQLDLDWGYPPHLFENMAPMAREWLRDLPGSREVQFDGFDPQWWIFLQKV